MKQSALTPIARYTKADHETWTLLFARQQKLVKPIACKEFLKGTRKLALDPKHVPQMNRTSKRIVNMGGWTLMRAKSNNLSMADWFPPLKKRAFPVTAYIRPADRLNFTAMPDLVHEYVGHLPFFTDRKFCDVAQKFGVVAAKANHRQLVDISRIWTHSIEFGLIKERGKIKLLGAGLLSSFGESQHVRDVINKKKKGKIVPFELPEVIATAGTPYKFHDKYFVLNKISDILDVLTAYAEKESLPI